MSNSFISCFSSREKPPGQVGVWLDDSYARLLIMMAAFELITAGHIDLDLEEWAARTARKMMLTAIYSGVGVVNPELYKHAGERKQLETLLTSFRRTLSKLDLYGERFPGAYWAEHNLLPPGEATPHDLPIDEMRSAARAIVAHIENCIVERFGLSG
jgi:hypothetical protein